MSYQIKIAPAIPAELKALPGYVRAQARRLIDLLSTNPRPSDAQELRNKPGIYRIWLVGRWRIAYTVDDDNQIVRILRVRRKEAMDYESLEHENGRPDDEP